jgi:hypothetical protein
MKLFFGMIEAFSDPPIENPERCPARKTGATPYLLEACSILHPQGARDPENLYGFRENDKKYSRSN